MQKSTEQAAEWQEIWGRQGVVDSIIDAGRTVYNWFFAPVLMRYLSKDASLLEMGCGRASLTLSLAPKIRRLVGVDISDVAVNQANEYARKTSVTNAEFIVDDCTKLALTEKFDAVWSQGLIEHFDDPITITREHFNALKPGGAALISVPYLYSYHTVWYNTSRLPGLRWIWPWTEQRFFDQKQLLEVGKAITPHARTFLLQPFPLGIVMLELQKPKE
jgi:2-polyprenyl-3-methyl-5-hydroxy-6-metoxy-1,4-benzoquinol methylase